MNEIKFSIDLDTVGDVKLIKLHGYLDAHTAPHLETAMGNLIQEGNA